MLERLLAEAERAALERVAALPNGTTDYFDKRLRANPGSVTP